MGHSATMTNVLTLLSALETVLTDAGHSVTTGAGVAAATEAYGRVPG
jgi:aspartate aminotransferase-like enzyme